MVEEYSYIMTNDVWEVVPRLVDRSVVCSRWMNEIKYVPDESMDIYKDRFVAKGYAQKEGTDYEKTFAPIVRYAYIRYVIFLVVHMAEKYLSLKIIMKRILSIMLLHKL